MKRINIFLADGFEEIEALTVVDLLRRAGAEVTTLSVTGELQVTGARSIPVIADALLENAEEADMVVLPGGMPGTNTLKAHAGVRNMVQSYFEKGKLVAAICAAPTVLGDMGLLRGKKATCYPGMEEGLAGAECSLDKVVQDGTIITSRGLGTAIDFSLKIIEVLVGKEKADEIAGQVVYTA